MFVQPVQENHIDEPPPFFTMREVPLEGFETGTWLPYPVTILNFSEETAMDGMDGTDGHMEFWDFFGPNESADPAEGHQFHRFQPIKSHLCHCPAPLEKPWEPTKPMIRGPDGPEIGHGGPRAKKTLVVLPRRYQNELLVKIAA